jgi:glucan 1,3-beta-glucosidase
MSANGPTASNYPRPYSDLVAPLCTASHAFIVTVVPPVTHLFSSSKDIYSMLGASILLSLAGCAVALNARYEAGSACPYPSAAHSSSSASTIYTPASSQVHSAPGHGHSVSAVPYPTSKNNTSPKPSPTGTPGCAPYWQENIKHQGLASFNPDPESYQVFRNVKEFGAKG